MLYVELIIGPMFSGKSTELIRRLSKFKSIDKKIFVIGHQLDDRYSKKEVICTHDQKSFDCVKVSSLDSIMSMRQFKEADVVGIDEAQFFPKLRSFILKCEKMNKTIMIAGLDGDFKREPFQNIVGVLPLCDKVDKLNAMCSVKKDGTPAIFSKRITKSTKRVEVGGSDQYVPVCREAYFAS